MKSNKILSFAVASILGTASVSALAAVNLSTGKGDMSYFASEIDFENSGSLVTPPALYDAPYFTTTYNVQAGNKIFARCEITGAVIKTSAWVAENDAILIPANNDTVGVTNTDNVTTKLVEGGEIDGNYAIFELNALPGAGGILATDRFHLDMGTNGTGGASQLVFANTASSSSVKCELHNDLTSAQLRNPAVKTFSAPVFGFTNALVVSSTTNTATAIVAKEYKEFSETSVGPKVAQIGVVTLGVSNPEVNDIDGSGISDVAQMFATGASKTTLTVRGDFSLATAASGGTTSVWIQQDSCDLTMPTDTTAMPAKTLAGDYTSVTFAFEGTSTYDMDVMNGDYAVCYSVPGDKAIPASQYTFDLNGIANTGYVSSKLVKTNQALGTIKRDGVILRSGFVSKAMMQVSRIILANTGATDSTISAVKFYGNAKDATVQPTLKLTLPYVLKAGSRTAIEMADLVDLATMPIQNTMIELQIGAQDDSVFGTYQLLLSGSTVQTIVPLERPVSSFKTDISGIAP